MSTTFQLSPRARIGTGVISIGLLSALCAYLTWVAPARYLRRLVGTRAFADLRVRGTLAIGMLAGSRPLTLVGDSRIESAGPIFAARHPGWVVNAGLAGTTALF